MRFLGFREDVCEVYQEVRARLDAPEPYGNAVLEAMTSRRVLVAAAAGGVRDLVDDSRTGVLVAPGDPEALAAAIERLLRPPDEQSRLADAGRRHVEEGFSRDLEARALERI